MADETKSLRSSRRSKSSTTLAAGGGELLLERELRRGCNATVSGEFAAIVHEVNSKKEQKQTLNF